MTNYLIHQQNNLADYSADCTLQFLFAIWQINIRIGRGGGEGAEATTGFQAGRCLLWQLILG